MSWLWKRPWHKPPWHTCTWWMCYKQSLEQGASRRWTSEQGWACPGPAACCPCCCFAAWWQQKRGRAGAWTEGTAKRSGSSGWGSCDCQVVCMQKGSPLHCNSAPQLWHCISSPWNYFGPILCYFWCYIIQVSTWMQKPDVFNFVSGSSL